MRPSRDRGDRGRGRGGRGTGGSGPDPRGTFAPRGGTGDRGGGGFGGRGGGRGGGGGGQRGGQWGGRPHSLSAYHPNDDLPPVPDTTVTQVENALQKPAQKSGKGKLPDISQLNVEDRFPLRPGYGTQGTPVTLWANYFQMMPKGNLKLYRYAIDILPAVTGGKCRRLIELLLTEGPLASQRASIASDYRTTLISKSQIDIQDIGEMAVAYKSEHEDTPGPRATTYRMRIQQTGVFTVAELVGYLTSTNVREAFADEHEITQALNIILGHHPKTDTGVMSVANKHYPAVPGALGEHHDLLGGLIAWRGYFISVRTAAARLLVNVQVKHAAAYDAIELDKLIGNYKSANGPNIYRLEKFLKKIRVETTHLPVKKNKAGEKIPRVRVINGFATKSDGQGLAHPPRVHQFGAGPKNAEFFLDNSPGETLGGGLAGKISGPKGGKSTGKKGGQSGQKSSPSSGPTAPGRYISVYDFFRQTYQISARDDLPVVNVGSKANPSYLPAEVCVVLHGQPAAAKLSSNQTARMIDFAVRTPYENAPAIAGKGLTALGLHPQCSILASFGFSVSTKMLTVPGRILGAPSIKYRGPRPVEPKFGSWNMAGIQFKEGKKLGRWSVLMINEDNSGSFWRDPAQYQQTVQAFVKALNANGVIAPPPMWPGKEIFVNDQNLEATVDQIFSQIKVLELLLIVLPKNDPRLYNCIKYCGDIKYGIHTICVVASKFGKSVEDRNTGARGPDLQYFANVALKFNLKMGGVNQSLPPGKLGVIGKGKTMVVGIDVTHPSPGSADNAPSIASMVASVDRELGQWPAILSIQESRKEMVTDLGDLLKTRLELWQGANKSLPENIIVYRDGVSEGQYQTVLDQELPLLQKACTTMYSPAQTSAKIPHFTIIIVGKRHHTRFYPTSSNNANQIDVKSSNPKNGTVVDRGVTNPRFWEFYLQAHTAIKGTARPAHYVVVHDEIFERGEVPPPFKNVADVLEDLTHNMSYMFGRATKAVSICPPAYYADLVCTRARCYMSGIFDATPGATPATSVAGSGAAVSADASMVQIHDKLKDTMFYI